MQTKPLEVAYVQNLQNPVQRTLEGKIIKDASIFFPVMSLEIYGRQCFVFGNATYELAVETTRMFGQPGK